MSTRSATIVRQITHNGECDKTEELFRFYRHCDGYPEGHGMDLALACIEAKEHDAGQLNNRNWAQHVFAHLFAKDIDIEIEPYGVEHGDIEYLYVIEGEYAAYGGKIYTDDMPVTITIYGCGWDDPYDEVLADKDAVFFEGTPEMLIEAYGR